MTIRAARRLVDSVLDYLERRQKSAALRGERMPALLLVEAWQLVYESFYGRVRPPEPDSIANHSSDTATSMRDKPWFREKQAKPIRRVTREFEYTTSDPDTGRPQFWYGQRLECGHVVMNQYDTPGVKRRKHIRCSECARAELTLDLPAGATVVQ